MTSGTYGRTGSGLSTTSALQRSLASRLQARTGLGGSILYRLIWKERATPSGRRICALRASDWTGEAPAGGNGYSGPFGIAPIPWLEGGFVILPSGLIRALSSAANISGNASTLSGWPTTRAEDGESAGMRHSRGVADTLTAAATHLAGWPTAAARDYKGVSGEGRQERKGEPSDTLPNAAATLAGWGTPTTSEPGGSPESSRARKLRQRAAGKRIGADALPISQQAQLSGWATPKAARGGPDHAIKDRPENAGLSLPTEATLAGWPTASARDHKDTPGMEAERKDGKSRDDQLPRKAYLAGWGTPTAEVARGTPEQATERKRRANEAGAGMGEAPTAINHQAQLSGWTSPRAHDSKGGRSKGQKDIHGTRHGCADLPADAALTGWPTPMAATPAQNGNNYAGNTDSARRTVGLSWGPIAETEAAEYPPPPMMGPARLTADGRLLIGSSAAMDSGGQLNPELPRWLMRLPAGWASCAPTETASMLKRQRASSKS